MRSYSAPSSTNLFLLSYECQRIHTVKEGQFISAQKFLLTFRFFGDLLEMNSDSFVQTVREISLHLSSRLETRKKKKQR